jgi:hypothetical protein
MTRATDDERPPPVRDDRRAIWAISIIGGVIASAIFALFLQPILSVISNITVKIVGTFYQGYLDSLYEQATMKPAEQITFLIFLFLFIGWISLISGIPVAEMVARRYITRGKREEVELRLSMLRTRLMYLSIAAVLVAISGLVAMSGSYISIQASAAFDRRLMALSPVISESERNGLLREWAMMHSKAEYDAIKARIIALAQKYNTTLPTF